MATLYFNDILTSDGSWGTTFDRATGSLSFSGQPTDADTITFSGVTFEFNDNALVTDDNIAITIGDGLQDTLDNLKTAIENNVNLTGTVDDGILNLSARLVARSYFRKAQMDAV